MGEPNKPRARKSRALPASTAQLHYLAALCRYVDGFYVGGDYTRLEAIKLIDRYKVLAARKRYERRGRRTGFRRARA